MLVASDTAGTRLAMPCDYWVRRLVTRPTAQSGAHATCHALLRVAARVKSFETVLDSIQ
jgi:hypothetical protein